MYGDHLDLHRVDRRQRQMCIRDRGYDSVAMDVDVEVGGNDQTFNMLAGRELMKDLKQKEKFVLTAKLLADPDGKKMGKSEGNMITLDDAPDQMFGKVMSWTDGMIADGFELCTDAVSYTHLTLPTIYSV